jgi:pimeloyl-ACP methyl ester carboxylesterase
MVDTIVMCPALSARFFGDLTSRIRKLPLRFVDVTYPPRDLHMRLSTLRQAISTTIDGVLREGTRPQDVAVLGYSIGGYLGIQAAAAMPERPGALILLASPASWALRRSEPNFDRIMTIYGSQGIDTYSLVKEMEQIPAEEEADAVAGRLGVRTLYIRGKADTNISPEHPRRFHQALGPLAHVVELDGDHFLHGQEKRLADEVRRFLQ